MTWQWFARFMSNEPDVAKGLEITLLALGRFGCVLEAGSPVGAASPQQNDPCTQGPVRAEVEGGLEWCGEQRAALMFINKCHC